MTIYPQTLTIGAIRCLKEKELQKKKEKLSGECFYCR